MRTFLAAAAVAAGLIGACGGAQAQFSTPFTFQDPGLSAVPTDPRIGVVPYRARVYGYYRRYDDRGPRVYSWRTRRGCDARDDWHRFWWGDRCRRWW
jgi:hypothetical protein